MGCWSDHQRRCGSIRLRGLQSPFTSIDAKLSAKDLRGDSSTPTMLELRQGRFPINMLNKTAVCPLRTRSKHLPGWSVSVLQAMFTRGGLILAVLAQHQAMDMTGETKFIRLLSTACRNKAYTEDELSIRNIDRSSIIPFAAEYTPECECSANASYS